YCALRLRIPKTQDSSWNYAFEVTKFSPFSICTTSPYFEKGATILPKKSTPGQ
ncbi:Hypothetical protein FKW44_020176, partial [Caligus rogercresseyi]